MCTFVVVAVLGKLNHPSTSVEWAHAVEASYTWTPTTQFTLSKMDYV